MKSVCCSFCSLDAIFISDRDNLKACPKHKSKVHEPKRIKIPINKESKKILYNFAHTLKKRFNARLDGLIEESKINQNNEKYVEELSLMDKALHDCNRFVIHFLEKQFVETKLILSPFDYFLTQPKEKAQQYIEKLGDQNDLLRLYRSVKIHSFDFNYFKFEDSKFIHGWVYKSSYNLHDHLLDFWVRIFLDFIKIEEYEMAYEWYQNLKSDLELYGNTSDMIKRILVLFGEIFEKKIIQKQDYFQLEKQWKQLLIKNIVGNLSNKFVDNPFKNIKFLGCLFSNMTTINPIDLLKYLFSNMTSINPIDCLVYLFCDLVLHMASKDSNAFKIYSKISLIAECFSQFHSNLIANRINQELGLLYYGNKNYHEAIEHFKKSIDYHKERLRKDSWDNKELVWDESLSYLIEAYRCLVKAHSALKNNKEIIRILKLVESECSETKDKLLYDATTGEIYYYLNDFDKAYKIIWKCIKICKQKKFINSYELSNLRLLLADIYVWRGDFKKAHESLCEAKSFYSILPIADPNEQEMYKTFGVFYLNRQWYDDALINFGKITDRWPSHELLFAKFSMGIAYFWKLDYQNARDFLNEAKSMMSSYTESNKNELFIANAYLGALFYLQGNLEDADKYFSEAFEFIDYYDILNIDIFLKSQRFVFNYFYGKNDYEKCGVILLRFKEILENYNHLKFRMPLYFIQLAELHIVLNEKEQAKERLCEAEKLLNIDKIFIISKKSIKINDLDCISDYIDIAKIYIYLFNISDESLRKAEKILKYAEDVVSEKRRNDQFSKLDVYILLGDLYFKTQRYKKSKRYFSKALDFQEKINHNLNAVRVLNQLLFEIDEILARKVRIHIY
ncbi:unnamed protein product [Blepharisma stoltei]|uniref:Tetratricopeptide repeat protein 29 n=1 Tax=Blepharisma stoltei TaxID=1481888 RepID=A0AAU9JEU7_9CILI|nr:unnamed protein product [Blepharisma stoltei]